MKTSPKRYKGIDFERVVKVLRVRADQLYSVSDRFENIIDATTAEDLVQAVIQEFFEHPSGMDWDPKKGRLETFLRKVLDRRWIDRHRRESKVAASFDDNENPLDLQAKPVNPLEDLERQSFFEFVKKQVGDRSELIEFLEAVEILDDDCLNSNQELAELLKTSVKDVENMKKRLRRLLSGLLNEK